MGLLVERIPTLQDNYTYLVICEASRDAAVIDAPEVEPVVARVEAKGARVTKLLATHHHADHCMANPALARRYQVPVFGHASDASRIPGFTDGLEEGDAIQVGEQRARILHVPAHTSGHIAYVFDEAKAVFSGDTLFAAGCGRIFEGTAEMMFTALVEKLGGLPDDTRVFCGHEYTLRNLEFAAFVEPDNPAVKSALARVRELRSHAAPRWHDATPAEMSVPSTIADERATNPFLRSGSVAELARRRALKDRF
jgi:hydroxyacylglutathione hydrolase